MTALKTLGPIRSLALVLAFASAAPALADGPFQFFPLTPCRVADTRNAAGVNGGPAITVFTTRQFRIQGNCGVPVGAKAVTLNVTVVQPAEITSSITRQRKSGSLRVASHTFQPRCREHHAREEPSA